MASSLREKILKIIGSIITGSAPSWPKVTDYLGVPPDFLPDVQWGTGVGMVFGATLLATKIVQRLAMPWRNISKVLVSVALTGIWLYLNWRLFRVFNVAIGSPNITDARVETAEWTAMSLAFLWAAPLTYIGALLGKTASDKFN